MLEKLDDPGLRDWYSVKDIEHGWSRPVLAHQIKTHLHLREGAAPSNFPPQAFRNGASARDHAPDRAHHPWHARGPRP
ncbi:hypothetical protein [Rhodococcus olei]|uniref:hypothetical protein n=1 Tax=Rhodococcus olei TaxID=2161675 RepID=UPI003CD0937C